jgi:plasmid stability protein
MVVYLPPELATELRVRCARERRSLSDAVTAAVEASVPQRRGDSGRRGVGSSATR